jgi:hypothetical protein
MDPKPVPRIAPRLGALFRKPPSDGAFRYLFSLLDLSTLETALSTWIGHLIPVPPEQLRPTPLDGKTLCGSDDRTNAAPEVMAGLRNAAISLLRLSGATNIAEALRENFYHVRSLLANLGIVNL